MSWATATFPEALREIEDAARGAAKTFGAAYADLAEKAQTAREAVERGERVCVRCWGLHCVFAKADAGEYFLDEKSDELMRLRPKDVCDSCIRGYEIGNKPRV